MSCRRFVFVFLFLILVFFLVFPGMILAQDTSAQGTTSSKQQEKNSIRIEVSENGFKNTSGELPVVVEEGQEVEITFVYADITPYNNRHIIHITGYNIDTEVLGKDNPEVTVKFTANKTGEFYFTCILTCMGHQNLQRGIIVVKPVAGSQITTKVTLTLDAPDQTETGQPLTLTALIKDELGEPVARSSVKFLVESDFFVKGLMEIGEVVTNEQGLAKIDYIPNQASVLRIVARYEAGSGLEPVEAEKEIKLTGSNKYFYQTLIGIQFPNSFLIWMIMIAVVVISAWSTLLFVLFQVLHIPTGTQKRRFVIILIVVVAALCIMLLLVLVTPEHQYNFGLLP